MKGHCKYGSRLCRYTHPGVCARWRAGKCSKSCSQNLLHQELPKRHGSAVIAQNKAENNVAVTKATKTKQRENTGKSLSRSTSRASSSSGGAMKTKKKTKRAGSNKKKKTDGHKPRQSPQ